MHLGISASRWQNHLMQMLPRKSSRVDWWRSWLPALARWCCHRPRALSLCALALALNPSLDHPKAPVHRRQRSCKKAVAVMAALHIYPHPMKVQTLGTIHRPPLELHLELEARNGHWHRCRSQHLLFRTRKSFHQPANQL